MSERSVYRMSSCGYCAKRLSAMRLGFTPEPAPSWLKTAADEGNWHEERIKTELRNDGYDVYDEQLEVTLDFPNFMLVGHIDGKTRDAGEHTLNNRVLEIKSMSQYEFDRWARGGFREFPTYADQLSAYMTATGLSSALYIVKNRSSGYTDRFIQEGPPSDFDAIIQKLLGIEWAAQAGQLIEAEYDPSSIECRRCPFRNTLCLISKEQLTEATERELLAAVETWRKGKLLEVEAKTLIEEGRKVLENHAEAASPEKKFNFTIANAFVNRYRIPAIGDAVSYPKKLLEEVVPEELLAQVREVKPARWQCVITDLEAKSE